MRWISGILVIGLLVFGRDAWGQTCSITATAVNFGDYDASLVSSLDGNGDISVTCDANTAYTVKLDTGKNSSSEFDVRKMRLSNAGDTLKYNLYKDAARTKVWGDGTDNTYTQTGLGSGEEDHFIVYGRIPERQNVRVGPYSDTVTVTVEW